MITKIYLSLYDFLVVLFCNIFQECDDDFFNFRWSAYTSYLYPETSSAKSTIFLFSGRFNIIFTDITFLSYH